MSTLTLQGNDLNMVRRSWATLQSSARGESHFMNKLFANMIIANPHLGPILHDAYVVREQAKLIGEMISFTMDYLDNVPLLTECMQQFVLENPSVYELGVQYIEYIGISLINTFHHTLGKSKFPPQVEGVWIKVYLFMANTLLLSGNLADSDARSAASAHLIEMTEANEAETIGLTLTRTPSNPLYGPLKVKFQLSSNEKYKGFRRGANEDRNTELEARIPRVVEGNSKVNNFSSSSSSASFSSSTAISSPISPNHSMPSSPSVRLVDNSNFDPRKLRKNSKQPTKDDYDIPAKNPRRLSSTSLASTITKYDYKHKALPKTPVSEYGTPYESYSPSPNPVVSVNSKRLHLKKPIPQFSDSEFEEEVPISSAPFDPRKLRKRQSASSLAQSSLIQSEAERDAESVYSTTEPLFSRPIRPLANNSYSNPPQVPQVPQVSQAPPTPQSYSSTFIEDEDEEADNNLLVELLQMTQPVKQHNLAASHSPCLRGLAPIREMEYDDDTSSKYDSDDSSNNTSTIERSSSQDEVSSGMSSLSLHNSDYRSSISSENASPNFSPQAKDILPQHYQHGSSLSQSIDVGFKKPLEILEPRTTYVKKNINCRASPGFLRSSFVLQNMTLTHLLVSVPKEKPTDSVKGDSILITNKKVAPREVLVLAYDSDSDDECLDLLNLFAPRPPVSEPKTSKKISRPSYTPPTNIKTSRSTISLSKASFSLMRSNTTKKAQSVLDCDVSSKRSIKEILGISSRSASRLNSLTSNSAMCKLTSDLCSIKSIDSVTSLVSGFSFFTGPPAPKPIVTASRRSLIDTRRLVSTTATSGSTARAPKYNKVKKAKYNFFGSILR